MIRKMEMRFLMSHVQGTKECATSFYARNNHKNIEITAKLLT